MSASWWREALCGGAGARIRQSMRSTVGNGSAEGACLRRSKAPARWKTALRGRAVTRRRGSGGGGAKAERVAKKESLLPYWRALSGGIRSGSSFFLVIAIVALDRPALGCKCPSCRGPLSYRGSLSYRPARNLCVLPEDNQAVGLRGVAEALMM